MESALRIVCETAEFSSDRLAGAGSHCWSYRV